MILLALKKEMGMRRGSGFTLIELMIVVAIVGVLASLAVPAYQAYTTRAKVSEVMAIAAKDKTTVAEFYINQGSMPSNAAEAGINTSGAQSVYVSSVNYSVSGNVATLSYSLTGLGPSDATGSIIWTGTGSDNNVDWVCTNSTLPDKYLPACCRG